MDALILFNSHPHKEDDRIQRRYLLFGSFSTHILTRRMTKTSSPTENISLFNSHPHKEDDGCYIAFCSITIFSTHILTSRMTQAQLYTICILIFQLTSSQGGWLFLSKERMSKRLFNSHPHKEDDNDLPEPGVPLYFSTHILTRRMTSSLPATGGVYVFQLTSSQGGWQVMERHSMY